MVAGIVDDSMDVTILNATFTLSFDSNGIAGLTDGSESITMNDTFSIDSDGNRLPHGHLDSVVNITPQQQSPFSIVSSPADSFLAAIGSTGHFEATGDGFFKVV